MKREPQHRNHQRTNSTSHHRQTSPWDSPTPFAPTPHRRTPAAGSAHAPAEAPERVLRRPHERQPQLELTEEEDSYEVQVRNRAQRLRESKRASAAARKRHEERVAANARQESEDYPDVDRRKSVRRKRRARSSNRLEQQAPQSERRRLRDRRAPAWMRIRKFAFVLVAVAIFELGLATLTAPQFSVVAVEPINGLHLTPENKVQVLAAGLIGQNWLRVQTNPVELRMESIPTVREVQVTRALDWPPRLELTVQEREPFARVGVNGQWWVVDQEGVPFRRASKADEKLYAITGPVFEPHLGQALPTPLWRSVLSFTDSLEQETERNHRWALRRIYFDKNGYASLRLRDAEQQDLLLRLGNAQWGQKLERAQQALDFFAATGRDPEILDLRSFQRPTWRPRNADQEGDQGMEQQAPTETDSSGSTDENDAFDPSSPELSQRPTVQT